MDGPHRSSVFVTHATKIASKSARTMSDAEVYVSGCSTPVDERDSNAGRSAAHGEATAVRSRVARTQDGEGDEAARREELKEDAYLP